jgi:23S rRNA (cytidine1920-2'-O)/16S rRNA (cytidine1409-2'-O)-methyltransferase
MEAYGISARGRICADVGASTGGFTDCLLQRGAARVYAIDVGHGQLHWKLRDHPRVVLMERTNARYLDSLPEPVSLVTIDVAFISLGLIFPVVRGWLEPGGEMVALIKPQFEAARRQVEKGGVVRDRRVHREVVNKVVSEARENDLAPQRIIQSPLRGPKGNLEFLLWCQRDGQEIDLDDLTADLFQTV